MDETIHTRLERERTASQPAAGLIRLRHVFPAIAMHDVGNYRAARVVFSGNVLHTHSLGVQRPNAYYVRFRKPMIALPFAPALPSFGVAIRHVLLMRAQKQMRRVTAAAVITLVQHVLIGGYRPVSELPGDAMGVFLTPTYPERSVAVRADASGPIPTTGRFIQAIPKAFLGIKRSLCDMLAGPRTVHGFPGKVTAGQLAFNGAVTGCANQGQSSRMQLHVNPPMVLCRALTVAAVQGFLMPLLYLKAGYYAR